MSKSGKQLELDLASLEDRRLGRYRIPASHLKKLMPRLKEIVSRIESERASGMHRYRSLPFDQDMRNAVETMVLQARPKTKNLVVLGIGGSALGNTALQSALNHPQYNLLPPSKRPGPRLFIMDNVDPDHFAGMLDILEDQLTTTTFNVISKSGETAETASQFLIIRDLLVKTLGASAARKRLIITTDARQGTMRSIVEDEKYECLPVPDGVGGRFSVLSAVGLFSAAMCGIDIRSLLKGAREMNTRVMESDIRNNPAAMFAAVNYLYYQQGIKLSVMMPYSNALYGLADWFRQLWAESLGKEWDAGGKHRINVGPTPIKALGTTDQHSQVQLYREGPNDKLITFLEVEQFARSLKIARQFKHIPALSYLGGSSMEQLIKAEKKATELALLESKRPCMTIRFPVVNAYAVGQFIYMLEAATTIAGYLFEVNPYDQPGVELGKQITYHLMGKAGFERMPGK